MSTSVTGVSLVLPDGFITDAAFNSNAEIAISRLAQQTFQKFPVPFTSMRVWDAMASLPVTSGANDDLALITGTPGTNALRITTGDMKTLGGTTRKIGFEVSVPPNYEDGQTIEVRIRCGMETTVADTAANVDLQAYVGNGTGGVGSDLVTSTASNCNSLTAADKDFVLSASSVDPGDRIQGVISFFVNDAASNTAVTGAIYEVALRCDTRG